MQCNIYVYTSYHMQQVLLYGCIKFPGEYYVPISASIVELTCIWRCGFGELEDGRLPNKSVFGTDPGDWDQLLFMGEVYDGLYCIMSQPILILFQWLSAYFWMFTKCSLLLVCSFMITILSSLVWLVDCLWVAAFALLHAAKSLSTYARTRSVCHLTIRCECRMLTQYKKVIRTLLIPLLWFWNTVQNDLCSLRRVLFWESCS